MTLLDFPEHVACTVFLGGCDFRCPFCHNYELIDGTAKPVMDDEEFFRFLSGRKGLLDGVAITGGEPCLHPDLPAFMRKIREMGFAVKLDTNGYHPEVLKSILEEGLADYMAMDIKNSPAKYAQTAGIDEIDLEKIRASVSLLINGSTGYEFRTTVIEQLHEKEDFYEMGELIRGADNYFLQSFTDRDSVPYEGFSAPSQEKMEEYAQIMRKYVRSVSLRGT